MIKKFIKISGTGKFLNYIPSAIPVPHKTTDFEKINLIYGDNGSGKTTLSLILSSLKGNDALLSKKRSFDQSVPQIIEILTDIPVTPMHTYNSNTWNQHYPNIEIFDIHFINDNIYTGLEIQNSHKKNLFEVIFGLKGIQLKFDIQTLKEKIQEGNKINGELRGKIEKIIDSAYKADDFCSVQYDPDIDNKIKQKEQEIITAKDFQNIQDKSLLKEITSIKYPFDAEKAKTIMMKSIDSISQDRKSTRLNSSHIQKSRMPSSA